MGAPTSASSKALQSDLTLAAKWRWKCRWSLDTSTAIARFPGQLSITSRCQGENVQSRVRNDPIAKCQHSQISHNLSSRGGIPPNIVPCSPSLRGNGSAGSCAARPKAARNAATSSRNNTKLQIKVHKQAACVNKTKMIFSNNQTIYSEIHKDVNNRTPPSGQSLAIRLEALLHFSKFFIDSQSGHGLDASSIQL